MIRIALFLLISICSTYVKAQTLTAYIENGKWGLKNKTGQIITQAKFTGASNYEKNNSVKFIEGLTKVSIEGGKVGFIDTLGNEIIPIKYLFAIDFSDGVTIVQLESKKYAALDKTGNTLFTKAFNPYSGKIIPFKFGYAIFTNGNNLEIVDKTGKTQYTFKVKEFKNATIISPTLIAVASGTGYFGKQALYSISGNKLSEKSYDSILKANENGLIMVSNGYNNNITYGFLDDKGREVIPVIHSQISPFNKNNIFSSSGSLYNEKNEVVKKANRDTGFYSIEISKYYVYGYPYANEVFNSKNTYLNTFRGIMNDKFKPITRSIFFANYLRAKDENTFIYKINNKTFTIAPDGKITPDDGSLEYENALASMPDPKFGQSTSSWKLPNKMLQYAVEKNYDPAQKLLDSLYADDYYTQLNPEAYEKYAPSLEKNALIGNLQSMYQLGKAYLIGTKIHPKNIEKGLKWLQQASSKNHAKATYDLAYHYIRNLDEGKAQEVLNNYKGAKNFQLDELYAPGGLYHALARFSGKDEQKLDGYFSKAIALGNLEAAYEYGVKLLSSADANKIAKGLKIMEENCQKGQVKSMIMMGNYYSIYANNPSRIDRNKSNAYYNRAIQSGKASIYENQEAKVGIFENQKSEPLAVGTILNIDNQRKAIVFRDTYGFRTNDNKYYTSALANYTDFKNFNIVKGAFGTKKCNSCNGTGKIAKQVVSGNYTTTDVTYKTGSTISGDKKITTTTTHNTYKSVDEKCLVCNGNGLVGN